MEEKELTPEELESQNEAEFEAGRASVRSAPEAAPEVPEAAPEAEPEVPEAAPEEEAEEQSPALIAGLTEDELKAALAKANELDRLREQFGGETQKIYGKFGELQREIKKLSEGRPSKVTAESLKRLSAEYPELAEALAEDLAGFGGSTPFDSTELEQRFNTALEDREQKLSQQFEVKILTLKHPDWQEKRSSPDFKLFLGTQPKERQEEITTSQDGLFAAQVLDEFDTWKTRGNKKTNRLERAIAPKGAPPDPKEKMMSDEAAFESGRKAVMKLRGMTR